MKPIALRSSPARACRAKLAVAVAAAIVVSACGGGGGDGGAASTSPQTAPAPSVTPTAPAPPTDKAQAIAYQYERLAEFKSVMNELAAGDQRAFDALDAGDTRQWDDYWLTDYPALVAKLQTASENVRLSEEYIHALIYGIAPAAGGEATPKLLWTIPVWLTAAAAAIYIYNEEQKRLSATRQAPTPTDTDRFIDDRARYWQAKGLAPIAARTRAIAEAGQVQALRGTLNGIEHATTFVTDAGLKPAAGALLPERAQSALDLKDLLDTLGTIRREVQVILTGKACRTQAATPKSAPGHGAGALEEPGAGPETKAGESCEVYFCTTASATCPNVPVGQWDGVVLADGHLRDIDLDVDVRADAAATLDVAPTPVAQIGAAPRQATCSTVQNAGGDTADSRIVQLGATSGTFTFSHDMVSIRDRMVVHYDGVPILDTGCVSGRATRTVSFAGLSSVISVQVEPNCAGPTSGTRWSYTVTCPPN